MQEVVRLQCISRSPGETTDLACRLGERLRGGEVLALTGDLGSGKTTFARGLARGLGCPQEVRVTSPTFTLEHIYPGRVALHHFDAYRLAGAGELLALGFEERLETRKVVVVEWADRVASCLPETRLEVRLELFGSEQRNFRAVRFSGLWKLWDDILRPLAAWIPGPPGDSPVDVR